ncbi:MAG: nucleotidyltransferase domain-containing protein [Bacteroidales bacterium]|nr:nucleotidyltransferase domain-containing protein [Bacteroidales bacterium]
MEDKLTIEMLRDFASKTMEPGSKVWLYGSRARGDNGPNSDWDLLVLLDTDKVSHDDFVKYGFSFIMYGSMHDADVSTHLYTYSDWEKRRITPYYQNVQQDKKIIYGA